MTNEQVGARVVFRHRLTGHTTEIYVDMSVPLEDECLLIALINKICLTALQHAGRCHYVVHQGALVGAGISACPPIFGVTVRVRGGRVGARHQVLAYRLRLGLELGLGLGLGLTA